MIPCIIHRGAVALRLRLGWKLLAFAAACSVILACAGSSVQPWESHTIPQSCVCPAFSGAGVLFTPAPNSRVELRGTATIGSWKSSSADIHGKIALDTDMSAIDTIFDQLQTAAPDQRQPHDPPLAHLTMNSPPVVRISVPITSLHGDSNGMDRDMRRALRADQYPFIEFIFEKLQPRATLLLWNSQDHQMTLRLTITGQLYMAGASRSITMDVFISRDSHRHVLARAQTFLLMSDFGVTPPSALFGLIKADNQVSVQFDLDLVDSTQTRPDLHRMMPRLPEMAKDVH